MVVNRSALVPRTQRKKLELNPSYSYGARSKNASKCTMRAHLVHGWYTIISKPFLVIIELGQSNFFSILVHNVIKPTSSWLWFSWVLTTEQFLMMVKKSQTSSMWVNSSNKYQKGRQDKYFPNFENISNNHQKLFRQVF